MISIKQFALQRNITQVKVKELCQELWGKAFAEFNDKQVGDLDKALGRAALSLPSNSSLATADAQDLVADAQTPKVVEIIGVKQLQQNLVLFLSNAKKQLDLEKFKAETLVFQTEQAFYGQLSQHQLAVQNEASARMTKNSLVWSSEGVGELKRLGDDPELLDQLDNLMSCFGL